MDARAAIAGPAGRRRFFLACLALVLAAQVASESLLPLLRNHGESLDDYLIYVSKSVQLFECPLQDCPAYRDVAAQIGKPATDYDLRLERYRAYQGSFLVYHPLYSVLLEALYRAGFSYAQAFMWLGVAGAALVVLAIALLMKETVGPLAAGVGLLAIAPNLFALRGMVVPSVIAVGLCMLLWAMILRYRARSGALLVVSTPLLLGLHFVALPLVLTAGMLYLVLVFRSDRRRALLVAAAVGAVAAAFLLIQNLVAAPVLKPAPVVYPEGLGYADVVGMNVSASVKRVLEWGGSLGHAVVALPLAIYGATRLKPSRRGGLAVLGALVGMLLAVSLLYAHPLHPGEVFRRFWFPAAVLLTGLWARGLCAACRLWYGKWLAADGARRRRWMLGGLALAVGLAAAAWYAREWHGSLRDTRKRLARVDAPFSAAQVERLKALARPGDGILVMQWDVLFHVYAERLLDRRIVYFPALGPDLEREWPRGIEVKAGLAWHPFRAHPRGFSDGLEISRSANLTIGHDPGRPITGLRLRAASAWGADLRVRVTYADGGQDTRAERLDRGESRWIAFDATPARPIARIQIDPQRRGTFLLQGLARSASARNWPWDEGLWLERGEPKSAEERIVFEPAALFAARCRDVGIVDDSGYLVLARLKC